MARRLAYGGLGIVVLGLMMVAGLRSQAVSADDASAGKKNSDVITRLESRIAALESRIAALEKQRAIPAPSVFVPGPSFSPGDPNVVPPRNFDGAWAYTILIDGKDKNAAIAVPVGVVDFGRSQPQR